MKELKNEICNILDSFTSNSLLYYSLNIDKKNFGNTILDVQFETICIRSIKSRDEFEMYICPKTAPRYTYTLKEVLLVLKLEISYNDYPNYIYEALKLIIENQQVIRELFSIKNGKPIMDNYVYKSNRINIWQ